MGYSYGRNERGNMVLSCDNCGNLGGVRKRSCPHMVLGDSLRSASGQRHQMHYCYPPALCPACWGALGGNAGVHGEKCKTGAARSQAEYDQVEAWLDAGEMLVISASGASETNGIPAGMVRVTFKGRAGCAERDVPADDYDFRRKPRLSDYETALAAA